MADIVERIIAPYNPPDQRVIQKTEYTMFVPIGTDVNPGILGYDTNAFTTKDGVLYLSKAYRAKIERAIALGDWLPEQVKALELSISMAIGRKFSVTPSASQVTVTDKYLLISEIGVIFGEFPEMIEYLVAYNTDDGAWYLGDGLTWHELESLASIGLSAEDDYTDSFTVTLSIVAVEEGDDAYHNNSKYYSEQAAGSATEAAGSATDAAGSATDAAGANTNAQTAAQTAIAEAFESEGYAVGTQNEADVQQGSKYYHNNSKYYADQARYAEAGARVSEDNAQRYKQDAADSADAAYTFAGEARDARDQARSARDQARAARDEVLGALGDGVEVDPIPDTVPKRDANGKLFAAAPVTTDGDNVVATKGFVNSSVSTNTANFLGTYTYTGTDSHSAIAAWIPSQLPAGTTVTNNDYVYVQLTVDGNTKYERYKYSSNDAAWGYEYELNNSSFTAAQWAAINSGITAGDIAAVQAALDNIADTLEQHQSDLGGLAQDINTLESTKQNVIDTNHKLASDLVDDTNQTHKFVSATEKATWNAKQAALTAGKNISLTGNTAAFNVPFVVLSASAGDTIDVANGTVALSADHSAVFANNDFVRVQCNDLFGNNGDTYVFQRRYNEPAANNQKVEYFEYADVGFYGNPLATKAHQYTFFYTTGTTPIILGFIDRTADGGSGASYTAGDGISIENNTISVDLDYYTASEIDALWYGSYTITASVTNGAGTSGSITGKPTATATITITPSEGYALPATVTVTNATLVTYNSTTGDVTVTEATGNVTVTAVCESAGISDLTGTTWRFNLSIEYFNVGSATINFTSNNNNYTIIRIYPSIDHDFSLRYGSTNVYDGGWKNESYRTISITGGTDATNSDLISYIQSNADRIS